MKAKLVASCLAVGIFAISASVEAASRSDGNSRIATRTAEPLGERFQLDDDSTRAKGPGLVYDNTNLSGYFLPLRPVDPEEQANLVTAEDMILAPGDERELVSYRQRVHQRASEGDVGFTAFTFLYEDDGGGVEENMPAAEIAGASCTIPDMHGIGRPDEGNAVCAPSPSGDSGIILPEKLWAGVIYEGGCIAGAETTNPDCILGEASAGPGSLLSDDIAEVGSTEFFIAISEDAGATWGLTALAGGGGFLNPALDCRATVPPPVPTVSEWGMVVIAMLVLPGGTLVLRRSRRSVATA